jgi:hypothetical protein
MSGLHGRILRKESGACRTTDVVGRRIAPFASGAMRSPTRPLAEDID